MRQRRFRSDVRLDVVTIIGSQAEIGVGQIRVQQDLRIDGKVEATIFAEGRLVIGQEAHVRGDIAAREMVVGGHVSGTIIVEGSLALQATAVVEGRVVASRLTIEEGASGSFQAAIGQPQSVEPAARSLNLDLFDQEFARHAGDGAIEADSPELEHLSVQPSLSEGQTSPTDAAPEAPGPELPSDSPPRIGDGASQGTDRFW